MQDFSLLNWIIVVTPILLVGGAIWLFARAIFNRRPRERSVKEAAAATPVSGEHEGLKGWLLLLGVCIFVTPLITAYSWLHAEDGLTDADINKLRIASNGQTSLYVVVFLLQICTIICLAQRSKRFKSFYIAASIAIILLLPLDLIWLDASISAIAGLPFGGTIQATRTPENLGIWLVTIIPVTIAMLYVIRSRRVANTFVR